MKRTKKHERALEEIREEFYAFLNEIKNPYTMLDFAEGKYNPKFKHKYLLQTKEFSKIGTLSFLPRYVFVSEKLPIKLRGAFRPKTITLVPYDRPYEIIKPDKTYTFKIVEVPNAKITVKFQSPRISLMEAYGNLEALQFLASSRALIVQTIIQDTFLEYLGKRIANEKIDSEEMLNQLNGKLCRLLSDYSLVSTGWVKAIVLEDFEEFRAALVEVFSRRALPLEALQRLLIERFKAIVENARKLEILEEVEA